MSKNDHALSQSSQKSPAEINQRDLNITPEDRTNPACSELLLPSTLICVHVCECSYKPWSPGIFEKWADL